MKRCGVGAREPAPTRSIRIRGRIAAGVLVLVAPLFGCQTTPTRLPSQPSAPPIVVPLPSVSEGVWNSRGHVIASKPLRTHQSASFGNAWWARYTSVSGLDGTAREVSGTFFTPPGVVPSGGWPVISLAHGTTGIGRDCAPSADPALRGYLPVVDAIVEAGYAVAVSDYEGLGTGGRHPYLEPRTAAFNIGDAVRALRELTPTVSTQWAAIGESQGGQAAWAANEFNRYYGDGLRLVGSVALAPAVNVSGLVDLVSSGSMTREQIAMYPIAVTGLAQYHTELHADALLHGHATDSDITTETCRLNVARVLTHRASSHDMKADTEDALRVLGDVLRKVALPQRRLDQPMLVINGSEDATVLPQWVSAAVAQSCEMGGLIAHEQISGAGHGDLMAIGKSTITRWVTDRFAGAPAESTCGAKVIARNGR